MYTYKNALEILKEISQTFYLPIVRLPDELLEAVASSYLCIRAIYEIENHPKFDKPTKVKLLKTISLGLQTMNNDMTADELSITLSKHQQQLSEVTIRISEWAVLAPETIAPRIWSATATMADRVAYWVNCSWQINTESDLDCYTFSVAGAVGLLLSDLWAWYDGTQTNRTHAIGFGRGLQAVKILRNRSEDLTRQVNLFPHGWSQEDMHNYARRNLYLADYYTQALARGSIREFCQVPLTLAHATLNVLALGQHKLSHIDVLN